MPFVNGVMARSNALERIIRQQERRVKMRRRGRILWGHPLPHPCEVPHPLGPLTDLASWGKRGRDRHRVLSPLGLLFFGKCLLHLLLPRWDLETVNAGESGVGRGHSYGRKRAQMHGM